MEKNNKLGIVLMFFITILIGVVLLNSLADSIYLATTLSGVDNESITITNTANTITNESITMATQIGTTGNTSLTSVTFFGNVSISTHHTGIEVDDEVNWTKEGTITVSGTNFSGVGPYNISYTYSSDATGSTVEDDITGVTYFGNASISTHSTGIEVDDEVNWTSTGVITPSTFNFSTGIYNISYGYEGDEYLTNTTAQTLIILIRLFFALAIVIVAFLFVRKNFEDIF